MNITEKLAIFAKLLELQQRTAFAASYPGPNLDERMNHSCTVTVKIGSKYARVDVGTSGKYMVNLTTQEIVGIKAYGVPHLGRRYGTLDTVHEWDWSGYQARKLAPEVV